MSLAAADFVLREAQAAVEKQGRFSLALSGGSTPRELYQLLSQPRFSDLFPWAKTHLFWGDERWTPKDNPDSNFQMAQDAFLSKIPLPKSQIYPMETEGVDAEKSAEEYEKMLRSFFAVTTHVTPTKVGVQSSDFLDSGFRRNDKPEQLLFAKKPGFDLMLLGIGPDGHTASIFPSGPALGEKTKWVMSVPAPEGILPRVPRITLTFPIINLSKKILFLSGLKDKEKVISDILELKSALPSARVQAQEETHFYLQGKKDS